MLSREDRKYKGVDLVLWHDDITNDMVAIDIRLTFPVPEKNLKMVEKFVELVRDSGFEKPKGNDIEE